MPVWQSQNARQRPAVRDRFANHHYRPVKFKNAADFDLRCRAGLDCDFEGIEDWIILRFDGVGACLQCLFGRAKMPSNDLLSAIDLPIIITRPIKLKSSEFDPPSPLVTWSISRLSDGSRYCLLPRRIMSIRL